MLQCSRGEEEFTRGEKFYNHGGGEKFGEGNKRKNLNLKNHLL
jgi:hypothetical protein